MKNWFGIWFSDNFSLVSVSYRFSFLLKTASLASAEPCLGDSSSPTKGLGVGVGVGVGVEKSEQRYHGSESLRLACVYRVELLPNIIPKSEN